MNFSMILDLTSPARVLYCYEVWKRLLVVELELVDATDEPWVIHSYL